MRAPTTYIAIGEFVDKFTWPSRTKPNYTKLFDKTAATSHSNAGAFKSTASELLSLLPVLAFYFTAVALPQGFGVPFVECVLACMDVVELLQCVKNGVVTEDQL